AVFLEVFLAELLADATHALGASRRRWRCPPSGPWREDVAVLLLQLGVAVDVLLQGRPLAAAVAVEELLGQLQHQTRARIGRVGHHRGPQGRAGFVVGGADGSDDAAPGSLASTASASSRKWPGTSEAAMRCHPSITLWSIGTSVEWMAHQH